MQRRKFILGLGAALASGSALIGSGAFTSVAAERDIAVNVADDAQALLRLDPDDTDYPNSAYATETDGVVEIDITEDGSGFDGEGISPFATTTIEEVFPIENQGTQEVQVSVESTDLDGSDFEDEVDFFATPDPNDDDQDFDQVSLLDDSINIGVGEAVAAGLEVDATGD
ncbi:MAG: DUF1102 domain-containing protein, partial [Halorubrum sp.]